MKCNQIAYVIILIEQIIIQMYAFLGRKTKQHYLKNLNENVEHDLSMSVPMT